MPAEITTWVWRGRHPNFGDELGPALLERLGYRVRRVPLRDADIVTIGSILEAVAATAKPGTIVWGTGTQYDKPCAASHLDIRAVRGHRTATHTSLTTSPGDTSVPVGDPGLLVPRYWPRPTVRHHIGVLPHYIDTRSFPWADLVINPTDGVDEVIEAIGSCAAIASSSLHGLVIAQAYRIPAMRLHHPQIVGGDHKYTDFLTALPTFDIGRAHV